MPRGPRLDVPGFVYHVMCRGIENQAIFKDHDDLYDFLDRLGQLADGEHIQVFAFALMPNHVHLLLRRVDMRLSTFMARLLTGYSICFNLRHKRKGHLFQNRYKSLIVDEDSYFLELVRYIHLNPVRAGVVANLAALEEWPFSGHSGLVGKVGFPWLDREETLACFSRVPEKAKRLLHDFMKSGLSMKGAPAPHGDHPFAEQADDSTLAAIYKGRILGDESFIARVLDGCEEPSRFLRKLEEPLLDDCLAAVANINGLSVAEICSRSRRRAIAKARAVVIWLGAHELGLSANEIANVLGVDPTLIYKNLQSRKGEEDSKLLRGTFLTNRK